MAHLAKIHLALSQFQLDLLALLARGHDEGIRRGLWFRGLRCPPARPFLCGWPGRPERLLLFVQQREEEVQERHKIEIGGVAQTPNHRAVPHALELVHDAQHVAIGVAPLHREESHAGDGLVEAETVLEGRLDESLCCL